MNVKVDTLSLLIADDDAGDRKLLKRTLRSTPFSCEITEASSIDGVLDIIEKKQFKCAVLDYHMPGGDVLEGVKKLKQRCPHMAIIMVTGQGDDIIVSEAFKAGVYDYLPKRDIKPESLCRIITNSIEKATLKRQIDEQNDALRSYTYILAHDLKAPIGQVLGLLDVALINIQKNELEHVGRYLEMAKKAAGYSVDLINTLTEYNKIDGEKISFEPVSMGYVVDKALLNLDAAIKEKNAKITCDRKLPKVTGNEPQLIQLFQNLIGNGIKYCREEIPTVHIGVQKLEEFWQFSITDNGIGISAKYHKKIFEMFNRIHSKTSEFVGSGIGLATCRKVIERHHGDLWCESEENKGATFYFTLPIG